MTSGQFITMGIDLGPLTVLVPAQVGLGLEAGPGLARLVDRHHAELVPFSLARGPTTPHSKKLSWQRFFIFTGIAF
jgi:hypothetical protein